MQLSLERACEIAGDYPRKRLIDELVLVRSATADADDFMTRSETGRLIPDLDDAAALCGYADLIRVGYPVKLAGIAMSRVRAAMRDWPSADQIVTVTLENGKTFALPADKVDVASGYTSGGYIFAANLVDVRNLRERVTRAIAAHEPEGEEANVAA